MSLEGLFLYAVAAGILMVGYYSAVSSPDLVRILISLELMFNSLFLALLPMFSLDPNVALGILVVTVFTSAAEFMVLIVAIIALDHLKRSTTVEEVRAGGEA